MFWRFGGYANISTIDTLLDKPDTTLEELLDDPDLLQELKQHNAKLIEYLREENVLRRLLEYVIAPKTNGSDDAADEEDGGASHRDAASSFAEPDRGGSGRFTLRTAGDDEWEKREKTRLKYANVACEILSSETRSIIDTLMENEQHLRQFWSYLKREPPLDPLEAGYFTKVNETLLDKKTEEMIAFLKTMDDAVCDMLRHVDCPVVMDLLLKIISLEKAQGNQGIVDWLYSHDLIPGLLSYLSDAHSSATQTSAGDFLKAVITISANASQNEQSCIGPNELTRQLVSEPCVRNLIGNMLRGGSALTVGVGVIIEVIRKNNSDYDPDVGAGLNTLPSSRDPIYLGTLLRIFGQSIPDFMSLILNPTYGASTAEGSSPRRRELKVASGEVIEPLGFDRFKACELMAELLHCSNMALLNEPGSESYVKQRDRERERLKAEGILPCERELRPGNEFADTSMNLSGNSAPAPEDSGPFQEPRRLEVANGGDEDGFEDVTISGVLNDDPRDGFDEKAEAEREDENFDGDHLYETPHGEDRADDPSRESNAELGSGKSGPSGQSPATSEEAPLSPTSVGMTAKVGAMHLNQDKLSAMDDASGSSRTSDVQREDQEQEHWSPIGGSSPPSQSQHSPPQTRIHSSPRSPSSPATPTSNHSLEALSPHAEDQPAPLFSGRAGQPPPSPGEDESAADGDAEAPNRAEPGRASPGDGGESVGSVVVGGNESGFEHYVETDIDGSPVIGDYLKMVFVEHRVVPTILDFFFRFPWNNFLHNVVYDIVQQVFNGPMDRGFNRNLAIDLFDGGRITEKIVEGQRKSDDAQARMNMRLGYMGHLTLIAEEVVKFTERHPPDFLSRTVLDMVMANEWVDYVEHILAETRERDNAILGGVRPDMSLGPRQSVINSLSATQGFGNGPSAVLANAGLTGGAAGLDSIDLMHGNSGPSPGFNFGSNTLLSGFGSSSDEDDEEMEDDTEAEDARPANGAESSHVSNPHASALAKPGESGSSSSPTSNVPRIPPPPPPLNIPPSRARRQLAARLAMKLKAKQQEEHAANLQQDEYAADQKPEDAPFEHNDVEEEAPSTVADQQPESDIWAPRGAPASQLHLSPTSSTSSSDEEDADLRLPPPHSLASSSRPNTTPAGTRSLIEAEDDDEEEEEEEEEEGEVVDFENGDQDGMSDEEEEDSGELVEIKRSIGNDLGGEQPQRMV